jgi:hypothetical protein
LIRLYTRYGLFAPGFRAKVLADEYLLLPQPCAVFWRL